IELGAQAFEQESLYNSVSARINFTETNAPANSAASPETSKPEGLIAHYSERSVYILVLYQALRIAALLHDVGHPPFSHIVEYGLQEVLAASYQDHEKTGQVIAERIFSDVNASKRSIIQAFPKFCRAACDIACHLLEVEKTGQDELSLVTTGIL